jgi:hypothetical protein
MSINTARIDFAASMLAAVQDGCRRWVQVDDYDPACGAGSPAQLVAVG